MKTVTTLQPLHFNHPPSSRWATHMETDESDEWSTVEGETPLRFPIFYFITSFLNCPAFFSQTLSSSLPPSVLLTFHPVLTSLCPTSILPYHPPSSWPSLGTPRGRKTDDNSDTTIKGKKSVILLMVLKYILAFSSDKTEVQPVCIDAYGS